MRVDVEIFESGNKKLKKYPDTRGRGLSYIIKLPDEVCASHTKRVGDNKKNFTSQEARKSAAHCFILLKIFLKYSGIVMFTSRVA